MVNGAASEIEVKKRAAGSGKETPDRDEGHTLLPQLSAKSDRLLGGISRGVLPLVAGLFVLVQGLNNTGLVAHLAELLKWGVSQSVLATSWFWGVGLAFVTTS